MKRFLRRLKIPALALVALLVLALILAPWGMRRATSRYIYRGLPSVPVRPVGIVFGALVYRDGTMSDMLVSRVRAGAALYKAGKVQTLLLTGNDSGPAYDEVAPMKALALGLGVPEKAILIDGQSYRTYDSCYRARTVFHISRAVLVTQDFHLPRALYLARHMGIDAVGYPAPPARNPLTRVIEDIRERFAVLFAFADIRARRHPGFP